MEYSDHINPQDLDQALDSEGPTLAELSQVVLQLQENIRMLEMENSNIKGELQRCKPRPDPCSFDTKDKTGTPLFQPAKFGKPPQQSAFNHRGEPPRQSHLFTFQ